MMIPWTTLAWTQVHHGHLPLWNPYSGLGMPLVFNWQSASFSVPALVGYLVPVRLAYTVAQIVTLVIAGSGVYVLGRVLRLGVLGSATAATVYELSGPFMGWLGWPNAAAMAWAGWLFADGHPRRPGPAPGSGTSHCSPSSSPARSTPGSPRPSSSSAWPSASSSIVFLVCRRRDSEHPRPGAAPRRRPRGGRGGGGRAVGPLGAARPAARVDVGGPGGELRTAPCRPTTCATCSSRDSTGSPWRATGGSATPSTPRPPCMSASSRSCLAVVALAPDDAARGAGLRRHRVSPWPSSPTSPPSCRPSTRSPGCAAWPGTAPSNPWSFALAVLAGIGMDALVRSHTSSAPCGAGRQGPSPWPRRSSALLWLRARDTSRRSKPGSGPGASSGRPSRSCVGLLVVGALSWPAGAGAPRGAWRRSGPVGGRRDRRLLLCRDGVPRGRRVPRWCRRARPPSRPTPAETALRQAVGTSLVALGTRDCHTPPTLGHAPEHQRRLRRARARRLGPLDPRGRVPVASRPRPANRRAPSDAPSHLVPAPSTVPRWPGATASGSSSSTPAVRARPARCSSSTVGAREALPRPAGRGRHPDAARPPTAALPPPDAPGHAVPVTHPDAPRGSSPRSSADRRCSGCISPTCRDGTPRSTAARWPSSRSPARCSKHACRVAATSWSCTTGRRRSPSASCWPSSASSASRAGARGRHPPTARAARRAGTAPITAPVARLRVPATPGGASQPVRCRGAAAGDGSGPGHAVSGTGASSVETGRRAPWSSGSLSRRGSRVANTTTPVGRNVHPLRCGRSAAGWHVPTTVDRPTRHRPTDTVPWSIRLRVGPRRPRLGIGQGRPADTRVNNGARGPVDPVATLPQLALDERRTPDRSIGGTPGRDRPRLRSAGLTPS